MPDDKVELKNSDGGGELENSRTLEREMQREETHDYLLQVEKCIIWTK